MKLIRLLLLLTLTSLVQAAELPQLADKDKLEIRSVQVELQNFVISNVAVLNQWAQLQNKVQLLIQQKVTNLKLKPEDYDLDADLKLVPKAKVEAAKPSIPSPAKTEAVKK